MSDAVQGSTVRVLVAADKFKGSLTAVEVAAHVTAGLRAVVPGAGRRVAAGRRRRRRHRGRGRRRRLRAPHRRRSPGRSAPRRGGVRAARDGTAVVEMAEASGLRHLPPGVFAPLTATTYGTGELLRAALDAGARTDRARRRRQRDHRRRRGHARALGARLLDAEGVPVAPGGAALAALASADLSGLDPRLADAEVVLASDVDNPLRGPKGAAAVYGPQKGASRAGRGRAGRGARPYVAVLAAAAGSAAAAGRAGARRRGRGRHRLRGAGRPAAPPSGPVSRCCSTSSGSPTRAGRAPTW